MVAFGQVKEREFTLIEQGEYILTLSELEETAGQWGDRIIWKFLVAPKEDYAAYLQKSNGEEVTLWAFTDVDITIGSQAHELVQVLTGKTFDKGSPPPDEDDLLGKRCIGYVTHETPTRGKNAGKKREALVPGSLKPWKGPSKTVARNVVHEPVEDAPAPSMTPLDDIAERAALIEETKKQIRKAAILDIEAAEQWAVVDLESMTTPELRDGLQTIKDAIAAA
jgi:hypothetical protein